MAIWQTTYATAPTPANDNAKGLGAVAFAKRQIGKRYVYAGNGPDVFDCSGLTQQAWLTQGITIPRTSIEQSTLPGVDLDKLAPGDLVTYYRPVSHVAIYAGDGMVVSAADEALGIIYVPVAKGGPNPTGHRVPRDGADTIPPDAPGNPGVAPASPENPDGTSNPIASVKWGSVGILAAVGVIGIIVVLTMV